MKKTAFLLCLLFLPLTFQAQAFEPKLELLISEEQIAKKIIEVSHQINQDYEGKNLIIVGILNGCFMVMSDLVKRIDHPLSIELIKARSYGSRGSERGELTICPISALNIEGKDVLVVDDIFDSGITLSSAVELLQEKNPASIQSLVLLSKRVPKLTEYRPHYVLFEIDDYFVVGYGLDYKEYYRQLPAIYFSKDGIFE